jgi:hypothetical protein
MLGESEDEPTLGETMNRDLGLDPGFTLDSDSGLVDEARDEQDETVEESEQKQGRDSADKS